MLAMQVNHSSLPSLPASLRRFLLALILGTFRFSFSVSILLDLALSSSLSPPLGPPFHSVHSLLRRDGRREGDVRTLHRIPRSFFVSLPTSAIIRLSHSLPSSSFPIAIKFCVFQRHAPCGIRRRNARRRQNSGQKSVRTRARPRINSPELFCPRARADRMRLETRLPVKRRAPQA